ncbi:MAG: hypothetical protein ACOCYE_06250 [Pseudomonadota bacterium]
MTTWLSRLRHWLRLAPACRLVPGSAEGPLFAVHGPARPAVPVRSRTGTAAVIR